MRKNSQPNNTCCRFVEVVERYPQCPCDYVPPIPTGPPCPFKPASREPLANALQSLLQQPTTSGSNCPLIERSPQGPPDSSQLCVFSQPGRIDFKSLPPFKCSCVPGTCPELPKNVIRSLGFDPMCTCPCPQTVKVPEPEPIEPKKKHKRRKKDRTKSAPDVSKADINAKSSTDEHPSSAVSASMLGAGSAAENQNGLTPSAIQSASAVGAVEDAGAVTTAAGDTVKPSEQQEPKNSAYSGSSTGSLLLEGKGFKIYEIDGEKVLFNYSTKNCHLLKCKCSRKDESSCGCSEWVRLTKYKNCICPGARKIKKSPPILQYVLEGS